ncbi:sucrase/ferredoxin domain protein [Rhizophagus clarus]|uniref:Sucrase/ferredoxin domain protein n=1 Tax=Rhizophagus clarus TaxID=94130 RepID=A0A8H3QDQ7_9GLOM|nr:sucrase/ferredoxin domain protein [Rhizophagus clarus]
MSKPLGSRIFDIIQSAITNKTDNNSPLEDIEDIDPCSDCSDPCSVHPTYPSSLNSRINYSFPLQGTVKPYYKHVVISTGKSDWKSHIEDEEGSFAAQLEKAIKGNSKEKKIKKDKKNKNKNKEETSLKKPKILIANSSRKNDDDDPLFSEGNDILLFSDNILVRRVSPNHAAEFYNQFLRGHKNEENNSSTTSQSHVTFVAEPMPYKAVVLICSHMHRDKRCGVTAPLLKDEFDKILKDKGLDVESRNDGIAVYMSSHIGGHKFAGNVIVYRERQGIWGSIMNDYVQDESEIELK